MRLVAIPVKALILQGYFWPHVKIVRMFGTKSLQSRN